MKVRNIIRRLIGLSAVPQPPSWRTIRKKYSLVWWLIFMRRKKRLILLAGRPYLTMLPGWERSDMIRFCFFTEEEQLQVELQNLAELVPKSPPPNKPPQETAAKQPPVLVYHASGGSAAPSVISSKDEAEDGASGFSGEEEAQIIAFPTPPWSRKN